MKAFLDLSVTENCFVKATFQGVLSAGLFFCVSNSKPREVLSKARPHMTVFCKYAMGSLIGQFCLQIGLIVYMFLRARHLMPKVWLTLHEIRIFLKRHELFLQLNSWQCDLLQQPPISCEL